MSNGLPYHLRSSEWLEEEKDKALSIVRAIEAELQSRDEYVEWVEYWTGESIDD